MKSHGNMIIPPKATNMGVILAVDQKLLHLEDLTLLEVLMRLIPQIVLILTSLEVLSNPLLLIQASRLAQVLAHLLQTPSLARNLALEWVHHLPTTIILVEMPHWPVELVRRGLEAISRVVTAQIRRLQALIHRTWSIRRIQGWTLMPQVSKVRQAWGKDRVFQRRALQPRGLTRPT